MAEEIIKQETLPEKIQTILELANENFPKMVKASAAVVEELQEIKTISSDAEREEVNESLVFARDQYQKINTLRKSITVTLDDIKEKFMEPERPLSDASKDSEYNRVRSVLAKYDQAKIDEKNRVAKEAEEKKLRENKMVDLRTAILKKLNDLILIKAKKADEGSAEYFKATTLQNFDIRAEAFMKMKPKLPLEDYEMCFAVPSTLFLNTTEATEWIAKLKSEETHQKWSDLVVEKCLPIINEWRGKIPQLKTDLQRLSLAKDEAERKRIADEQAAKEAEDQKRRNREMEQRHLDQSMELDSKAVIDKLENEFVQQATTQELGDTGPVKYILKFTDRKGVLKALTTIMAHCMAHPQFPGIERVDKNKKVIVDDQGRPEYREAVQWWIDFFLKNCDVKIEGTTVYETTKTIVRK